MKYIGGTVTCMIFLYSMEPSCGLNIATLLTISSPLNGFSLAIADAASHQGGILVLDSSIQ